MRIIYFVLFFMALPTIANSCNMQNMGFGSSRDFIINQYYLDHGENALEDEELISSNLAGRSEISSRGRKSCFLLPEESLMDFIFINGIFVQAKIYAPNTSGQLLRFAENQFGELTRQNNSAHPDNQNFQYVWSFNDKFVVYSTHQEESSFIEYLEITSVEHQDLLNNASRNNDE